MAAMFRTATPYGNRAALAQVVDAPLRTDAVASSLRSAFDIADTLPADMAATLATLSCLPR